MTCEVYFFTSGQPVEALYFDNELFSFMLGVHHLLWLKQIHISNKCMAIYILKSWPEKQR